MIRETGYNTYMEKKRRICVIFTGGTIGSAVKAGTVDLDGGSRAALIGEYRRRTGAEIVFDELRPVEMLSENVRADDLAKIAETLRGVRFEDYDGVIVTHGTDTLCFTANYFSRIFCDAPVPIVFVSALFPLSDPRSNGHDNFAGAVSFIESADYGGVFVAFANPHEPCRIHLASRLVTATQLVGAYYSLADAYFGTIENGRFKHNDAANVPTEERLRADKRVAAGAGLCTDVVSLRARALLDFSYYCFDIHKPCAVVTELYHSGTICTAGEETSFIRFREYCAKLGVTVVLSPVGSRANLYASAKDLSEGCLIAYDESYGMTLVKVMSALYAGDDLQAALAENRFYEKVLSV